ncbi:MAG: hypothetical protein U0640_00845 [Phycisphaerales bacterium]
MGANRRRFVAKAVAGKGWRVWDTLRKRWWGKVYTAPPEELLTELNGEKNGERVAAISTEISRRKKR